MKLTNRSFTLSELLIAAGILAFVLSSLLVLFITCIFLNEASRNMTIAMSHAEYKMEELKNSTFATIAATYNGVCLDSAEIETAGLEALNSETVCTTVAGTTILTASVTVSWRDRAVRDRSLALRTLITEP